MRKHNKKGFTIVELVIVIAVIGILAAVLIPTFSNVIDKANKSAAEQTAMTYYKEGYALDIMDGVIDGNTPGDSGSVAVSTKVTNYSYDSTTQKASAYAEKGNYRATVTGGVLTTGPKP